MPTILLLHVHPAPHKSHAIRHLLEAARQVDGVTVRELYELYPDFLIDVPAEQRLMEAHDAIVLLHPFYWYSAPALLKEWLDLVLQHGWAYGDSGHALRGKVLLQAVTCGGSVEVYCQTGRHGHTVRDFLLPFEQSARLCGLTYLAPFVVHSVGTLQTEAAMAPYSRDFTAALTALRDGTLDLAAGVEAPWLNRDLTSLLRSDTASVS